MAKKAQAGAVSKELAEAEKKNPAKPVQLVKFSRKAMSKYGKAVIEERALPDFRDGMKPVQRRNLWSLFQLGITYNAKRRKAAFVVGDVMGKYHPHGDKAIFDSLVILANKVVPLVDGEGNWGGGIANDNAAAMRYIEARMSKYAAKTFFDPDYVPLINHVPNYDGSLKEPLILPALLPNLLVNGADGIAVAITCCIPSYTIKSLKQAIKLLLEGREFDAKTAAKILEFHYPFGGGEVVSSSSELRDFYRNTFGSVVFKSKYHWDEKTRTMKFYSFAPDLNIDSITNFLLGGSKNPPAWTKGIEDARDASSKQEANIVTVRFKKTLSKDELQKAIANVEAKFTSTMHYKINVTERVPGKDDEYDVNFKSLSVPELLKKWTEWRVDLETRMLKHKLATIGQQINRTNLLILAAANKKVVIESLDKDDPEKFLAQKLKITEKDAAYILDQQIRRLSKLDKKKLENDLAEMKKKEKGWQAALKAPAQSVLTQLDALDT